MLNRVTLIRILDESRYDEISITLNLLKEALINSSYEEDEDFIKEGRRTELFNDFYDNINKVPLTDTNLNASINALKDYIHGQSWIEMNKNVEVINYEQTNYKHYKDLVNKNDRYKEKGIISKEEKEIILNMIDILLNKITAQQEK